MSENSNIESKNRVYMEVDNTINLCRDRLSDNGQIFPESHFITVPNLDGNGNEVYIKDTETGEMVTHGKRVACMAIEVPTKRELATQQKQYWDKIQTSGNWGTGSTFGQITSFDHTDYKRADGTRTRRGHKVMLDGTQYTLNIKLTNMVSQDKPYAGQQVWEPLHVAGYRLVIDQNNDSRQFYHLYSDKPATLEEVSKAIGASRAESLIHGSTARTGA
tara:strand:- start:11 stop:664 length:654 start_codon:yes stop_codon:yes gene_type:complete